MITAQEARRIFENNDTSKSDYQKFMEKLYKEVKSASERGINILGEAAIPHNIKSKDVVKELKRLGYNCDIYVNSTQTELLTVAW